MSSAQQCETDFYGNKRIVLSLFSLPKNGRRSVTSMQPFFEALHILGNIFAKLVVTTYGNHFYNLFWYFVERALQP